MTTVYELYNWQVLVSSGGSLYVSGYLYCGKAWVTSNIRRMVDRGSYYEVDTENSTYYLV